MIGDLKGDRRLISVRAGMIKVVIAWVRRMVVLKWIAEVRRLKDMAQRCVAMIELLKIVRR